jgi:DNA-binding CsgD family transcriptional regulator
MEAPLHEATTLAEHAAHRRRRGASPADIEAVAAPARRIARSRGLPRVLRLIGTGSEQDRPSAASATEPVEVGPAGGPLAEHVAAPDVRIGDPRIAAATTLADPLTPRELEVLTLVAQGLRNRDIAAALVISEYTAANHVRSILMKTGSANRTQAARFAVMHRLIDESGDPLRV